MKKGNKPKPKKVQQANALIESSQKMTLIERRVMYHILSKVNPMKPDKNFELKVEDFLEDFDRVGQKNVYNQLKEAVQKLFTRSVQQITERGSTRIFHVLQEQEYQDNQGFLKLIFSDAMMPLIFELKSKYTTINFDHLKQLNSIHSLRIYELLCQYENLCERTISVEDLRFFLDCENSYVEFKEFKRSVIEVAIKEINKKTNMFVDVEYIRSGRKINKIKFNFSNNKQLTILATTNSAKTTADAVVAKNRKLPAQPSMKRHPNPKNEKYKDNEGHLTAQFYIDSFAWAVENINRINKYELKLKDFDEGISMSQKLIDNKKNYIEKITSLYNTWQSLRQDFDTIKAKIR